MHTFSPVYLPTTTDEVVGIQAIDVNSQALGLIKPPHIDARRHWL